LLDLFAVLCSHEDNRALFSEGGLHAILELAGITVMYVYAYLSLNAYVYIDRWMDAWMDRLVKGVYHSLLLMMELMMKIEI
jgi:hypothetical protein